jgi:hypothetical protein
MLVTTDVDSKHLKGSIESETHRVLFICNKLKKTLDLIF